MFGGIEKVTGNSFEKRDAATLVPLIQQYVRPGSVIFSDEWRAYSSLQSLGYTHHTVNHSQNFVDPNTGAHTQTVERIWGGVKAMMRKQRSMNSLMFETYLQEAMWRKKFDTPFCDSFTEPDPLSLGERVWLRETNFVMLFSPSYHTSHNSTHAHREHIMLHITHHTTVPMHIESTLCYISYITQQYPCT